MRSFENLIVAKESFLEEFNSEENGIDYDVVLLGKILKTYWS